MIVVALVVVRVPSSPASSLVGDSILVSLSITLIVVVRVPSLVWFLSEVQVAISNLSSLLLS